MKKLFFPLFLFIFSYQLFPQNISIDKIEPQNWWQGMKLNKIQLMVYGKNLSNLSARFNNSSIKIAKVNRTDNPSYAFIDIEIPKNIKPGSYQLTLSNSLGSAVKDFSILQRDKSKNRFKGFDNNDVIYLLMPDRFANGDVSNDSVAGYSDYMNKIPKQGRAGGDIQGVINQLDYFKDLGVTSLWLTPVVENNTFRSYHGYSATDFYNVDPRLGSNELYKKLVDEAHQRGLKIILDHVANHCSHNHPWLKNLPTKDWLNGSLDNHLEANHNKMVFSDPYADSSTIKHVEQGWFVSDMPDLNHNNIYVQNYIIQNTIWWMEYAGIDGIREDTYPYNNQTFMSRWAKLVLDEYPSSNIVAEVWSGETDFLSTYQKNSPFKKINSHIPSITDFAFRDLAVRYLLGKENMFSFYNLFAKDFLYTNPQNMVTFIDNHDVARVMYYAGGNLAKVKIAYSLLFTVRGIPQLFYGSEIGLVGTEDHGTLRIPFPGGFPKDSRNAFTANGRSKEENEIFDYIKELIHLRHKFRSLAKGSTTQYPAVNDVYVYFRNYGNETTMVAVNNNKEMASVDLSMMKKWINHDSKLINIKSGLELNIGSDLKVKIPALEANIYLVK